MIKAKIKKQEYNIKNSWNDLTFQDYLDVNKIEDDANTLSFLSGIDIETLNKLDELSLEKLLFCLDFLKETPEQEYDCKNIRQETFGQKILLQDSLKDTEKLPAIALAIYEYDYENLSDSLLEVLKLPFTEVYCKGLNYLEQFKEIAEAEAIHLKSTTTNEQLQAGVKMFDEFGVMNTIDSLANGNILNYDKVLKIDYNTVFIKLKMLKFASQYKENYSKIMNRKK